MAEGKLDFFVKAEDLKWNGLKRYLVEALIAIGETCQRGFDCSNRVGKISPNVLETENGKKLKKKTNNGKLKKLTTEKTEKMETENSKTKKRNVGG